ncbi:MAG: inositol monophosphatase family protein [Polyangiales bacterium]
MSVAEHGLDLAHVLAELTRIARTAGVHVMPGYRAATTITKKGAIDLVTEYDLASEAYLTRELGRTFPDVEIVAEESQGKEKVARSDARLRFYVDPIDGTTNFAHGHPFFCVSLGLCRGPAPIAGVVYAPALDVCWAGGPTLGTTRNGQACRVSSRAGLRDALCATGFGYEVAGAHDDNIDAFRAVQSRSRGVRRCGAAAMDLALVADGTYDAYWEFMLQPWDLAAGAALVLGAGGRIGAFDGGPVEPTSGAILASNGLVHDVLAGVIHEARGGRPVPTR